MGNVKIIAASAGSGKTYRLAYEYVRSVVENPSLYRHILAVTFTNKATEEMSARILERLHELATPGSPSPYLNYLRDDLSLGERAIRERAAEAQRLILHDYSRFAVLTIDRFFQRLIRSFMRELGIDGGFNLELETDSLLELAADALIEQTATDAAIRERVFAATAGRLEDGKRWDIRDSLVDLGGELFGEEYRRASESSSEDSGYDAALSTPLADPAAPAAATMIEAVIEKAGRAQAEMKAKALEAMGIIDEAGLTANDFKGRSRGLYSWLAKIAAGGFLPLSAAAREAAESDEASAWAAKTSPGRGIVEGLIPVLRPILLDLEKIHSENSRLVASAGLLRENRHNFLLLSDLGRQVERICREENIVPISETNRMIARLVGGGDTPFIFERAGTYFSRFLIDEFQDTSASQWENFVPLLQNAIASEPGTPVMLIGDVKQAIYRWRGSDWQILSRRVREQMGADRVESETLGVNYRSLRRVVEFNNTAVQKVVEAGNTALDAMLAEARAGGALSALEAAELTGMLAEAYTGHTQKPGSGQDDGYVTLTVYGENGEGVYVPPVVERIEELQSRGYRAGDIAVLVRSNTQGARIAQMLLGRKRENPDSPYRYDVVTQDALTVGASAASRFIIACLSLAVDPADTIQRAVFNRWIERDFDAPLSAGDAAFFARLAALSPEQAFEEIVLRFELAGRTADIAYVQAVHGQITAFSSRSVADLPLFLKWWNERGAAASITIGRDADAITVSTIHKSKGLQYKVVIVPYMSWTVTPDTRGRQLVVWAAPSESMPDDREIARTGLSGAGAVPINYKEAMARSYFSARYYREQVLAHIDAVNLLYVALTRAERELHLMTSSNPREGLGSMGNLLRGVLDITEDFTEWGTPTDAGADASPSPRAQTTDALRTYPTSPPGAKVRLRLPSARYIGEEGEGMSLSPRDTGVLMHRAFENASDADDVRRALDKMVADALVSPHERDDLRATIDRAFDDPLVAEWFGGEWDTVRNENDILLPQGAGARRPDRVMVRGGKAVVVDYKFGRVRSSAHAAQLRDYMALIGGMGYTEVEGYLWYISLGRIDKVE